MRTIGETFFADVIRYVGKGKVGCLHPGDM